MGQADIPYQIVLIWILCVMTLVDFPSDMHTCIHTGILSLQAD